MNDQLKIIFLDMMDYLNSEAKKLGFYNTKDMIYNAIDNGLLVMSDEVVQVAIHMCNIRNKIAHGEGRYVFSVTKDSVWTIYMLGIVLLGWYSPYIRIDFSDGKDVYFYRNNGELVAKLSKIKRIYYEESSIPFLNNFFS